MTHPVFVLLLRSHLFCLPYSLLPLWPISSQPLSVEVPTPSCSIESAFLKSSMTSNQFSSYPLFAASNAFDYIVLYNFITPSNPNSIHFSDHSFSLSLLTPFPSSTCQIQILSMFHSPWAISPLTVVCTFISAQMILHSDLCPGLQNQFQPPAECHHWDFPLLSLTQCVDGREAESSH